jgi:hypothetical protein
MLDKVRAGNPLAEALIRLPIARQCQQPRRGKHQAEDVVHEALHGCSPLCLNPSYSPDGRQLCSQKEWHR